MFSIAARYRPAEHPDKPLDRRIWLQTVPTIIHQTKLPTIIARPPSSLRSETIKLKIAQIPLKGRCPQNKQHARTYTPHSQTDSRPIIKAVIASERCENSVNRIPSTFMDLDTVRYSFQTDCRSIVDLHRGRIISQADTHAKHKFLTRWVVNDRPTLPSCSTHAHWRFTKMCMHAPGRVHIRRAPWRMMWFVTCSAYSGDGCGDRPDQLKTDKLGSNQQRL